MKSRDTGLQIALNLGTGWLASAIGLVTSLVMVPFLLGHLGKEGYGLIGLMAVIAGMTASADLGLRTALSRELSEKVALEDHKCASEFASTAGLLFAAMAVAFGVLNWTLAPVLLDVFKVSERLLSEGIELIRLYGSVAIASSFTTPLLSAGLASHHRFDLINLIQTVKGLAYTVGLFVFVGSFDSPLHTWVWVTIVFEVLGVLAFVSVYRKECPEIRISPGHFRWSRFREMLRLGGSMYLIQLTYLFAEKSDPMVVSSYHGTPGVATYNAGMRVSQTARRFVLALVQQLAPSATRRHVLGDEKGQQRLLLFSTKFTLGFGILVVSGMLCFAEPFTRLWLAPTLGEDYLVAARVMMLWALVDLLTYSAGSQFQVLLGMKRLKFLIWSLLPPAALNLVISILLVGPFGLGIPSVLYSTIAINLIRRPIVAAYTARQCGMRTRNYFLGAYARVLACLPVLLVVGWFLRDRIDSWMSFLACGVALTGVWVVALLSFGLSRSEFGAIRGHVVARVRARKGGAGPTPSGEGE